MANESRRLGLLALVALGMAEAAQADSARGESLLFAELPVVEAASLRLQSLEEAPATVTVITAKEIRAYGFRTLGEALAHMRGFYLSDDGIYQYLGTRGFSLPGDYATRILVMLNGHYLTDNVYSSNGYFGQDFPVDLDLVERIEIIRGPSSALYGSNGMFATINVVTLSPVDHPLLRASAELGSFGEKKLQLSTASHLGRGVNLLLSASAFATAGRDVDFPGGYGPARGLGRERGQHAFAALLWKDWSFTAMHGDRLVHAPHGAFSTIFNDPGNQNEDARSFLEAVYSRDLGVERQLEWRFYYDRYRYWGRWDLDYGDGIVFDNQDLALGDWVGTRITYSFPLLARGRITTGSECNIDLRKRQWNGDVFPDRVDYVNVSTPDRSGAAFGQLEWILSRRWTAYAGLRVDYSRQYGASASPRLALIWQRSAATTWKFLFGRAFRNPNAFEAFYEAPLAFVPNPWLAPETISMAEVAFERKLARGRMSASAGVFSYRLRGLIQGLEDASGLVQFRNTGESSSYGGELELSGHPLEWLNVAGNLSLAELAGTGSGWASVNSPARIASLRFGIPLWRDRLRLSGAFRHWSARRTISGDALPPVSLTDFTASTLEWHRSYQLQFGVRNLFDRRYFDPVGPEHVADRLAQRGRALFVKLTWLSRE